MKKCDSLMKLTTLREFMLSNKSIVNEATKHGGMQVISAHLQLTDTLMSFSCNSRISCSVGVFWLDL